MRNSLCTVGAVCLLSVLSLPALATNGYFPHGYSIKSRALGGAGVAFPLDAQAAVINPALTPYLGTRLDLSISAFNPNRSYSADTNIQPPLFFVEPGVEVESKNRIFPIPGVGYTRKLNDSDAIGISMIGNGGLNAEYNRPVFESFNITGVLPASTPTGVDLNQLGFFPSYGHKINENLSIGLGPVFLFQIFEAQGLEPFQLLSIHPDAVTNNGYETSFGGGGIVGIFGQLFDGVLNLGASYQSELYMTQFKDYEGLFAEEGDFNVPPVFLAGMALNLPLDLTFLFDIQRINYEEVASVSNSGNVLASLQDTSDLPGLLGSKDGLGFGWTDMTIAKLGLQWDTFSNERLVLRAGYSRSFSKVIPSEEVLFNILAPATIREHFTLGFTSRLSKKSEFTMAFMYAPNYEISGSNPFTGPQNIDIEMNQYELTLGYGRRF